MKHGKQHFVAQSYLRAWCDPETPTDQEPYVWRFSKDGTNRRRKAPENIFHETDLYTIIAPDGGRDLRLEHGLAQLEDEFVKIRDRKLAHHQELDRRDRLLLCAFVAAAQMRTPAQRDHLAGMWGQALEHGKAIEEWAQTATPAQRQAVTGLPAPGPDRSFSLKEVQAMAERPLQTTLAAHIRAITPMLARLDLFVLMAAEPATFITSDNPCVWFDAEACKRPPLRQGPGLAYPSIEITLPVSPHRLLLFHRRGRSGYVSPPQHVVDELNRRTVAHCADYFVTNANATRPIWFGLGTEPEDFVAEVAPQTRGQIGANMIDFSVSLTAVSLTFQLVSASPSAGDGKISADIRPVFTVGTVPASPGGSAHHGRHEHRHAAGSRALASTSGSAINLSSSSASGAPGNYWSSSDTISILVPDNAEHVKDGASDRIIEEALMVAAWQPFYFPPRAKRADWGIYRSIP